MTIPSCLDAALAYAAAGFAVLPLHQFANSMRCTCRKAGRCPSPAKHPRTKNGAKDASSDPRTIRGWWRRWPDANIAVVLDELDVVIDIDRHKKTEDGFAAWAEILKHAGHAEPATLTASTGGGGQHRFYKLPAAIKVKGKLGLGVETKVKGGYIVVDPSVHRSGRRYEWLTPFNPDAITVAPEWLIDLMRRDRKATSVTAPPPTAAARTAMGDTMRDLQRLESALAFWNADDREEWVRAGLALKAGVDGLTDADLFAVWERWSRGSSKFVSGECERKWNGFEPSTIGAGSIFHLSKARGWRSPDLPGRALPPTAATVKASEPWAEVIPLSAAPEVPAFPDGVFVGGFGDYLSALADAYQVPVDMPSMLCLGVGSSALAQRVRLRVRDEWIEEAVLWVLVLNKSGVRKSPVLAALMHPVHVWEREEGLRLAPVLARAREDRSVKLATIERLRRDLARADAKNSPVNREMLVSLRTEIETNRLPAEPKLVVSDTTAEALARFLDESGERCLIASGEADALDVLLGRYNDGRANVGLLLKAYNGEPERILRRMGGNLTLTRPLIALALAVQPEAACELLGHVQARARGFFARMMLALPPDHVGYRDVDAPPVPKSLKDTYATVIGGLLAWPTTGGAPPAIPLHPEAGEVLRAFRIEHERRMQPDGDLADCREWAAKEVGNLGRVALLIASIDATASKQGPPDQITASALQRALMLAPYLEAHQRAAGGLGLSPTTALAERLLRWIRSENRASFTARDAARKCRPTTETARDVEAPLQLLVDFGHVRRRAGEDRPGRPSEVFDVNPATLGAAEPPGQNGRNGQNPSLSRSSGHSDHSGHGGEVDRDPEREAIQSEVALDADELARLKGGAR